MSHKNLKASKHPVASLNYPMRLDQALFKKKMAYSRNKAEEFIKQGYVHVNGLPQSKASFMVHAQDSITTKVPEVYVSRAGLKLASVAKDLKLQFHDAVVLDVGSSTGGFTEFALRHGARKVIAIDVGTDQLHPTLQGNTRIELHEKTDIRNVFLEQNRSGQEHGKVYVEQPDVIVADVSFVSLRIILPSVSRLMKPDTVLIAMCKPQFEAGKNQINKGVIKNDTIRRGILKEFEQWAQGSFVIKGKADSKVAGSKGNVERFYVLGKR